LVAGYQAGADKIKDFVGWCDGVGIPMVTLWVLSTENLNRSEADELNPLLGVIAQLMEDLAGNPKWQVQLVGDPSLLPEPISRRLALAQGRSLGHTGMHINVAVAYGGRRELRDAVRALLEAEAEKGTTLPELAQTLEIGMISEYLYTAGQPDPDLIIRTSGEQRLSGFLMWQSAHSEFYFCEALWPDFRRVDFIRALRSYTQRERRFGR
jgi:short-chain Z-isoprenyl diphosphate synthase